MSINAHPLAHKHSWRVFVFLGHFQSSWRFSSGFSTHSK